MGTLYDTGMQAESKPLALIVGAGSGLSGSLARQCAAAGMQVALAARNTEKLKSFTGARLYACDAADAAQVDKLFASIETPDLVVYLRAPTAVLLERIRHRDRSFERPLQREYLDLLNRAYEEFFASFAGPAHVTIDVSDVDWIARLEDYVEVREVVLQTIANLEAGQGTFDFAPAEPPRRRAAAP